MVSSLVFCYPESRAEKLAGGTTDAQQARKPGSEGVRRTAGEAPGRRSAGAQDDDDDDGCCISSGTRLPTPAAGWPWHLHGWHLQQ